jgi:SAM-dependent methyltransferase
MISFIRRLIQPLFRRQPRLRALALDLMDIAARPLLMPFTLSRSQRSNTEEAAEARTDRYTIAAEAHWATHVDRRHAMDKPFSEPESLSRRFIDIGTLVDGLRLQPGDTVLEIGAGSCWLTLLLNRYGCRTIAVDVSPTALSIGRMVFDRDPNTNWNLGPAFLVYDGHRLPVPDASIDRIVLYDAFHHIPNQRQLLTEMRRVLRPDGIVGMSEPGRGHASSASTLAEAATGVLENELSLEDVAEGALSTGFTAARVIVASDSPLMEVDARKLRAFMGGRGFARYWRNLRAALDGHHYILLFAGDPEPTTARPRRLRANINRVGATTPLRAKPDEPIELRLDLYNSGDSRWLHSSDQRPGWTRLGGHLYRENQARTLIDFDWLRVPLPGDVMPERSIQVVAQLPPVHESGRYVIAFDLVVEGVTWFADRGSMPLTILCEVA